MSDPENEIGDDAELILLCDRLVAISAEEAAILDADPEVDDGGPLLPRMDALTEEWRIIETRLYAVGAASTRASMLAAARAAIAEAPRDNVGEISCVALAEWLAFTVADYVAREAVA
jgi:hypothetical protein